MSSFEHFSNTERTLLQARAARIGQTVQDQEDGDIVTALLVRAHDETYALPIDSIAAVYEDIPVVAVPCVPAFVAGIANIRGHIVPVLELAAVLGVPQNAADSADGALVLATDDDMTVAFFVDAVGEVMNIAAARLEAVPDTLDIEKAQYLRGTLSEGIILLDVAAILRDPALIVDSPVG